VAVTLVATLAGVATGVGTAGPAWAHSRLQRTDPADGSVIETQVQTVTLTFNERIHGNLSTVVVTGPGNVSYSDGPLRVIDDDAHQRVYPLKSGPYAVAWRAISADGHPVEGQFHFTVRLPPGQEPTAGPPVTRVAASAGAHGGSRTWLWAAGGAVAVLAVAVALLATRRRSGQEMQ
jgi:methionine-rich copper-binding protein CopC